MTLAKKTLGAILTLYGPLAAIPLNWLGLSKPSGLLIGLMISLIGSLLTLTNRREY